MVIVTMVVVVPVMVIPIMMVVVVMVMMVMSFRGSCREAQGYCRHRTDEEEFGFHNTLRSNLTQAAAT